MANSLSNEVSVVSINTFVRSVKSYKVLYVQVLVGPIISLYFFVHIDVGVWGLFGCFQGISTATLPILVKLRASGWSLHVLFLITYMRYVFIAYWT